ncbi:MAG: FGGY-family carbohydrate kinase [Chloroflexi bacterium]|nr:FGGY-family carbohydrate kinase [Chloroflexota bacterium]
MAPRKKTRHYLAIDFRSSHIKVAVGPASGAPLATARSPVAYFKPEGGPDTAVEFDPGLALRRIVSTIKSALSESGLAPVDISGIGVTSQRQGIVLLDLEGRPLYGGPNRDMRAVFEGAEIDSNTMVDVWELTGHGPGMLTAWARLKWFAANAPDIYGRARTVCAIADWIVLELTGELLMEQSLAVESGLGLVASGQPARALAPALNLGDITLPATCPAGTVVGKLKRNTAKRLGLPTGIPVVACGPDTQSGLLGLGAQLPNAVGIVSGWSTACQRVTERPVFDDTRAMWTGRHVIENRWVLEGNAGETGRTYQWLLSLLHGLPDNAAENTPNKKHGTTRLTTADVMDTIDDAIAKIEPGATGISSFLGPSFVHMANVGMRTGGLLFPVPISFEPPDRIGIARAALENFAFGIRHNLERLDSFRGPALSIAIGGGMVKTKAFRSILAGVLDCEIGIAESGETTSLGALSQIAAGTGNGPSIAEYAVIRATELSKYEPDAAHAGVYESMYDEWRHRERLLASFEV